MKYTALIFSTFFLLQTNHLQSQNKSLKIDYYYPKDSSLFNKNITDFDFNYEKDLYGKTTMIIHCESAWGDFEFVFKKKINKLTHYGGDSVNVYDGGKVVRKDYNQPYTISEHNLFAFVLVHDHGGTLEKIKFQDFGNEVYQPEFDYTFCSISDEDKDGKPEFYLCYMGESDGLDAKPFKQIIYTFPVAGNTKAMVKSKATAYYPAGNEEDVYKAAYDANWNLLPAVVQLKSKNILKAHKMKRMKK